MEVTKMPIGTGQFGDTAYGVFSPTEDPRFAALLEQIMGSIPQMQGVSEFLTQATQSPLLQTILSGALQQLVPGERAARSALTDRFRAAGALKNTAYGSAATGLEGELLGKRAGLIS